MAREETERMRRRTAAEAALAGPPAEASPPSARVAAVATAALRWPSRAVPASRAGVLALRGLFGLALPLAAPARGTGATAECVRGPVAGEWVRPGAAHVRHADAAVLYLHGGAYVASSPRAHRGVVARVARACGAPAFAARYRRGPEHRFPAAADDARAAHRWLCGQGVAPGRIVLAGDSAGGQLALGLALQLAQEGAPRPAALVLLSPLLDASLASGRRADLAARDPFFAAAALARLVGLHVDPAERDPRAAPLQADAALLRAALPPTLLQVGTRELLAAEAGALAQRAAAAGAPLTLQRWPGQIHVFQAQTGVLPEARAALADVGRFVDAALAR